MFSFFFFFLSFLHDSYTYNMTKQLKLSDKGSDKGKDAFEHCKLNKTNLDIHYIRLAPVSSD